MPISLLLEFSFGLSVFVVVTAVISYAINLTSLVSLVFSNVKILLRFADLNYKKNTFLLQRKESNHPEELNPQTANLSYTGFNLILTPRPLVPHLPWTASQLPTYVPGALGSLGFLFSTQQPE